MKNIRTYEEYIAEAARNGMLHIDLLAKYKGTWQEGEYREGFKKIIGDIKGFTKVSKAHGMRAGDVIEFTAGQNDDIRYTTEVLGFNSDGEVYVLWDCFWLQHEKLPRDPRQRGRGRRQGAGPSHGERFPIRVDETRDIKMVRKSK